LFQKVHTESQQWNLCILLSCLTDTFPSSTTGTLLVPSAQEGVATEVALQFL
ncbi:23685_t:CDS:1, partial [Dentiscutata erythropus]